MISVIKGPEQADPEIEGSSVTAKGGEEERRGEGA